MRHPQALRQQKLQFFTEPLAPMAQVGALVWKRMLEKLFPGEVLEVWIIDPALAHAFVRQPVNLLEQQQPDREPCRNPGPPLVAVKRGDLAIDKVPVDLAGELRQFVPQVDDLVQPGSEQIAGSRRLWLLRSHRSPPMRATESCFAGRRNPENEIASLRGLRPRNLAISNPPISQKPTRAQWLKKCSRTTQYLLFYYSVLLRRLRGLKKQL